MNEYAARTRERVCSNRKYVHKHAARIYEPAHLSDVSHTPRIHSLSTFHFKLQLLMPNSSMVDLQHFMSNIYQNKSITAQLKIDNSNNTSLRYCYCLSESRVNIKVLIYQIDKVRSSGTNIQLIHNI